MRLLFLDFETYYDDEYSLRRMPTPNYILDKRFECQMCAVQEGSTPPFVVDGPDFPKFISGYDPKTTITACFNALFDNSILAWRFGFVPNLMLDAMGMARALMGHLLASSSLENVAKALDLGAKGNALIKVKGMSRAQIIAAGLWPEFKGYALQDVVLLVGIFDKLLPQFPLQERRLMDLVLRCTVEPRFVMNQALLVQHIEDLQAMKADMLTRASVDKDDLMSTPKFAALLESLGVEVGMKPNAKMAAGLSEAEGAKLIPALAKTDQFMADLLEHEDERVQALAAARLGHKSTIEETRAIKLLSIATQDWPQLPTGGNMPVPLAYGRAHTQRLAGDWGMNMQNLPTLRGSKGKSKLRLALAAPEG